MDVMVRQMFMFLVSKYSQRIIFDFTMILHVYDNGYNRIISFSFLVVQSCPKTKTFHKSIFVGLVRKTATKQQNGIIFTNALSCLKKVVIFFSQLFEL